MKIPPRALATVAKNRVKERTLMRRYGAEIFRITIAARYKAATRHRSRPADL